MTMKPGRICKLRIDEVSLVDEGDNPGAEVSILKRRDRGVDAAVLKQRLADIAEAIAAANEFAAEAADMGAEPAQILKGLENMDLEALNARLGEIEGDLATITKERDDALAAVTAHAATIATLTTERDEAIAKAKPAEGDDDTDVLKDLPEAIRKRIENAEATAKEAVDEVAKARDERAELAAITKARTIGLVEGQVEPVGQLLHRIAKHSQEDADKVFEILKTAGTVNADGAKLFEAIGKAAGGDANATAAETKLEEGISAIQKVKPGTTREQAYAEVLDANPGLYDELKKAKTAVAG
jgi:hypothetical protein